MERLDDGGEFFSFKGAGLGYKDDGVWGSVLDHTSSLDEISSGGFRDDTMNAKHVWDEDSSTARAGGTRVAFFFSFAVVTSYAIPLVCQHGPSSFSAPSSSILHPLP